MSRNVRHKRCPECNKRRRWWKQGSGLKWSWTKVSDRWICYVCAPPLVDPEKVPSWLDQQGHKAHWAIIRLE